MLLQKGLGYSATYTSPDYPVLVADWVGSVSFYQTYPGTAVLTKALTLDGNTLVLELTIAEILNLNDGVYSAVATISSVIEGVTVESLNYATVSPVNVSSATKCKIFGTIIKSDGTPTGKATQSLTNTETGSTLVSGWAGVAVKVLHPIVDTDSGMIVNTEVVETTTNAAGYFEIYVLQGLSVSVVCAYIPAAILVDTTGLSEYDIFDSI